MTRHVTFYDAESGQLSGRSLLVSDDKLVELNTPAGHKAIDHPPDEPLDHLSQRVNPVTGEVESWQPPGATAQEIDLARRVEALDAIRRLERDEQPRAVREALLGRGVGRLTEIDERIAELRKAL